MIPPFSTVYTRECTSRANMIGKLILLCILLVIAYVAWHVWRDCSTGKSSGGLIGKLFAGVCHLI